MSIRLTLLQSLQTAIRAISEATTVTAADGSTYRYHFTLKATSVVLDPVNLEAIPATEVPFVVIGGFEPGERTDWTSRPNRFKDSSTLQIFARLDASGNDTDRKQIAFENFVADLEVALTQDRTRGGLALDTILEQPKEPGVGLSNQNMVVVQQPVKVLWQRIYGAP